MKQTITVQADGVDLTITFEGTCMPGIQRAFRESIRSVVSDYLATASITVTVEAEDE